MIAYSIIQKSQLEGALRLDAEFYQPEYFIDFSKGKWQSIGDVLSLCQYGISQAMNDEKRGYPIFKMNDIDDGFLFDDDVRFADIPPSIFKEFQLEKNDVLFNRVNSEEFVGRTGIYKYEDLKSVFASYLIRMQTKSDGDILPDYLNIFLNSAYGLKQIRKFARRAVNQANVNAEELKQIKIAILPRQAQEKIAELSNESWQESQNSKSLYSQAEEMLLEELGLSSFAKATEDEERFCIVNFSEIQGANRMDAEYFQPKYEKLTSKLKSQNAKTLEQIFSIRRGDFISPDYYVENAKRAYIRIKELPIRGDLNGDAVTYIDDSFKEKNIDTLKENDFVFAGIGATLGKVARITKELQGSFYSNNTARFRLKKEYEDKLDPQYAEIVFQSMVCQLQFEQRQAQTAQAKIADEELQTVLIPILPKETQEKIADLVRRSHESRKKAKQLLEQSKQQVEKLIENIDG